MTDTDKTQPAPEKKSGKKNGFKLVLIVLLAIIIVLSAAFTIFGEKAITSAAGSVATNALGVNVGIEAVTLKLFSGRGAINGLVVGNPEGFTLPSAMSMDKGTVAIDTSTLLSDEIHIKSINLDNIAINFEQKGLKSNFQVIAEGLKPAAGAQEAEVQADTDTEPAKKIVVDELRITNAKVSVKLIQQLGEVSFDLPDIVLKDLGKNNSMTLAQMSELVFTEITAAISKSGTGIIPADLTSALTDTIDEAMGAIEDTLKNVLSNEAGESIEQAGKALGEEAGKMLEGIGSLLGGKKE